MDVSWGQNVLIYMFCRDLNDYIQDLMLTLPEPADIPNAIITAIKCENCHNKCYATTPTNNNNASSSGPSPMQLSVTGVHALMSSYSRRTSMSC